jgi:hypothetical protein
MKKMLVGLALMSVALMFSGCVKKLCYVSPQMNQIYKRNVGDPMIKRVECVGRFGVYDCTIPLELFYLGHTGTHIRIGQGLVGHGQIIDFTYSTGPKPIPIDFQGTKFEVIETGDTWITYRVISIPTPGCDKVSELDVK